MATNSQRIDALEQAAHRQLADTLLLELHHSHQTEHVADLRSHVASLQKQTIEAERRLLLAEHQIAELRVSRNLWNERLWAVVLALVTALIGVVVGYALPR